MTHHCFLVLLCLQLLQALVSKTDLVRTSECCCEGSRFVYRKQSFVDLEERGRGRGYGTGQRCSSWGGIILARYCRDVLPGSGHAGLARWTHEVASYSSIYERCPLWTSSTFFPRAISNSTSCVGTLGSAALSWEIRVFLPGGLNTLRSAYQQNLRYSGGRRHSLAPTTSTT